MFFFIASTAIASQRGAKPLATLTHPTDLARRHTGHQRIGFHVFGDHGAGGNEGALAHRVAAHHRAVGAQRGAFANPGLGILAVHREIGPGRTHIGEHAAGTAEHVVLQFHALVNRHVVLDAHAVADPHVVADVDILAKGASLADHGTRLHVAEVPNLGILADHDVVVDIAALVYEVIAHDSEKLARMSAMWITWMGNPLASI